MSSSPSTSPRAGASEEFLGVLGPEGLLGAVRTHEEAARLAAQGPGLRVVPLRLSWFDLSGEGGRAHSDGGGTVSSPSGERGSGGQSAATAAAPGPHPLHGAPLSGRGPVPPPVLPEQEELFGAEGPALVRSRLELVARHMTRRGPKQNVRDLAVEILLSSRQLPAQLRAVAQEVVDESVARAIRLGLCQPTPQPLIPRRST